MREFLPEGWSAKKSSDYCLRVADGTHDTPKPAEAGRSLITSKNLENGRIAYDGAYLISETDYQQINKRSKVDRWDVLFSMIGTVGEIALVRKEPDFAIKNIGLFKSKTKEDGIWLYYYLTSSIGQAALDTFLSGTSQQFVALGDLRKVQVIVPTEKSKSKISAILSAYDELIENNQQRIALLKKMAGEIYREWFVRLRFPGHERVKVIKGVPAGWEQISLPEIANITYGFAFDGSRFNTEGRGKPIIRIRNIPESMTTDYTDEIANDKYIVRHGDLLVGMDGEFHINHWQGDEAYLVQRVCRIEAKIPILNGYLAYAIRAPIKHFESILMGATVGHLGAMHLKSISLLIPPEHLQKQLHVLNDIQRQILQISKATRALSRARDALLPRLISGKLSVDKLDIQFPPSMTEDIHA